MDYHRAVEIIDELYDYDPSVKVGRVGSSVTIGEIVEMAKDADTIERLQKELAALKREPETVAGHGIHELARMLDEMSELVAMPDNMKNAARTAGVALLSHAKALAQMQDAGQNEIGILLQERDAALAEVETAKAVENTLSMEINELQGEVERLKGEIKWWKREAETGQENVNFISRQERDWR